MQNSSEFQYLAIDTIHESTTNPRRTFDEASAATWKDLREDETPVVQPAQVNRLGVILQEAEKQGAAFAVIDTSPISESAFLAAARAADLVLIPRRPHLLDLEGYRLFNRTCTFSQEAICCCR